MQSLQIASYDEGEVNIRFDFDAAKVCCLGKLFLPGTKSILGGLQ